MGWPPNNRLPTDKDILLVCGAGDGGPPNNRREKDQGAALGGVQRLREDAKVVDKALQSAYFFDLKELGTA